MDDTETEHQSFHARYIEARWRRDMIAATKELLRKQGLPVYTHHHPLCSCVWLAPEYECAQCYIIATGACD